MSRQETEELFRQDTDPILREIERHIKLTDLQEAILDDEGRLGMLRIELSEVKARLEQNYVAYYSLNRAKDDIYGVCQLWPVLQQFC